jgi:hypothetical protein
MKEKIMNAIYVIAQGICIASILMLIGALVWSLNYSGEITTMVHIVK